MRRAELALSDLADLPLRRVAHRSLLPRCWALRDNLTGYDAAAIGPDIDLDDEVVLLDGGTRLTEARAAALAGSAMVALHARRSGRPSLTGRSSNTPNLTIRVAPETRAALESIAERSGRRLADVGRQALDEYIERQRAAS